jgi:tricarballylate dehydrogenase
MRAHSRAGSRNAFAGGGKARVLAVERAPQAMRGGNTRWSPSYMRLEAPDRLAPRFIEDMLETSSGRSDPAYIRRLAADAAPVLAWLQHHGITFDRPPNYFLTAAAPRIQPVGAGAAIVEALARAAEAAGVTFAYETEARSIELAANGAVGARAAGDWERHARRARRSRSDRPEPVVLTYPYGIVVDRHGRRFFDEGGGRVDETWETLARTIHFETPGRIAYAIFDASLEDIPDYGRAVCTDREPLRAATIAELAAALEIDATGLTQTVAAYNAAAPADTGSFEATRTDGLSTAGLTPPKSNWARRIERAPFTAYPLVCAICYTFGGIATDAEARVLGASGVIPGLFAAGEITGQFYGKAPGGTSVLRALVFGRIAGKRAFDRQPNG